MSDAYAPAEIARRVESLGVAKVHADVFTLATLSGLAGAFIALGALFFAVVVTGSDLGLGPTRLLGGVAFSLGLVLVVVAGAELFTGNNLIVLAWVSGRIRLRDLLRCWLVVYAGNAVGAVATALLAWLAGVHDLGDGAVGRTLLALGESKAALPWGRAAALGVLCNALVCLAVWMAIGARSVSDKILAVVPPVAAFVALGLEHSIANWFLLPYAWALDGGLDSDLVAGSLRNLVAVTCGNLIGGTGLVATVYWLAYLRPKAPA